MLGIAYEALPGITGLMGSVRHRAHRLMGFTGSFIHVASSIHQSLPAAEAAEPLVAATSAAPSTALRRDGVVTREAAAAAASSSLLCARQATDRRCLSVGC